MKHLLRFLVVAVLFCGSLSRADLAGDIRAALADKLLQKAQVGVQVVELGERPEAARTIFAHQADLPLIPASNQKLLTTAAALEILGEKFTFRTLLVQHGRDLVLIGDGDPTFGDAEMLRKAGWGVTTVFDNWAAQLTRQQVRTVANVLVDDSVFDEVLVHPNWPADQLHKRYVAQVAGMNLNANCVDFFLQVRGAGEPVLFRMEPQTDYVRVQNSCMSGGNDAVWLSRQPGGNSVMLRGTTPTGNKEPVSVTVHDPAMFAATVLAERLAAAGIQVTGTAARDRTVRQKVLQGEKGFSVVAVHETPIAVVLARTNKDSMNLYAEALLKRMGFAASGRSGSWESGAAAVGGVLKRLGVDAGQARIDDGCGLSRQNAVSALALCSVLSHCFHSAGREAMMASLAVAGQDGTLDKRFEGSDLRGRVLAKSGYIRQVSALSGYLRARNGSWYAFSILMNNVPEGSNWRMKAIQEQIVAAIDASASPRR